MKRYAYGLGLFVAGFAASYVLIYLYRWEWNRALMSAALLLVAEVALIGAATLDRLKRLEAKIDGERPHQVPEQTVRERVVSAPQFAWMAARADEHAPGGLPRLPEPGDRFGVFIPVIMGAGLALSALAWAVERLARATGARSKVDSGLTGRLGALSLPPGGPFAAQPKTDDEVFGAAAPASRKAPIGKRVAVTFGALAIAGPGVFLLAELTQSRPDPPSAAAATVLTIEVASNRPEHGVSERVHRRWELCRDTSNLSLRTSNLMQLDDRRFAGIVTPALGEQAYRRLAGCLEDAAVDFVQLRIVATSDIH